MADLLILKGRLVSGIGIGTQMTSLSWFKETIFQKYGFTLYPGTLNLVKISGFSQIEHELLMYGTVLVPPTSDICCSILLPIRLRSHTIGNHKNAHVSNSQWHKAILIRPLVLDYDTDKVEIVADKFLRGYLDISDGDIVDFKLDNNNSKLGGWISYAKNTNNE